MPVLHRPLLSCLRAVLAASLLSLATARTAATGGFSGSLSADEELAAGLAVLSTAELATLDQQVAMELALVRHGDAGELAGTFSSRRTSTERRSTGLDRLSPAERAKLDALLAVVLDAHPKPKERPRIKPAEIFDPARKPEIHGSVSVMVGSGGRGRSFWGSALMLDYFDPASGLGLSVGLSNFSGPGYSDGGFGYGPDDFGSRYDGPFASYSSAPSPDGLSRENFFSGDGQSFRRAASGDVLDRGRRRR